MSFTFRTTGAGGGPAATAADGSKPPAWRSASTGPRGAIPFTIPTPTAAAQETMAMAQKEARFHNGRDGNAPDPAESAGSNGANCPVARGRGSATGGTVAERGLEPDDDATMFDDEERRSA